MITPPFRKLLVANLGEIAIRVLRAATELGIPTVTVYSTEDRFALHCFKADEIYRIGKGERLIDAYLDIDAIIAVAQRADADAIHPGYGFLSENPAFANACTANGITFVAPSSNSMRLLGNKVAARGRGAGHARYRRPSRRSGRNGAAYRRRRLSADAEGKLGVPLQSLTVSGDRVNCRHACQRHAGPDDLHRQPVRSGRLTVSIPQLTALAIKHGS